MFVDEVDIHVLAGSGGGGALSFRREKFIPRGGPDGGDGGAGGSIYIVATPTKNTLVDFRFHPEFKAKRGGHGQGSNRTGQTSSDLEIGVPPGTLIFEKDPAGGLTLIADLPEEGQRVMVAKGGRGGRGNARFVSSTNRAPRRVEPGEDGEDRQLRLQLKLIADVGLIGFPNAGKSTLISRISAAKPKIAAYPFTTLQPNLGVVTLGDDRSFVVADVPGLIKGAHEGTGLGHQFLRHIERTKVLIHLVDVAGSSGRDPVDDFDTIIEELRLFDPKVAAKPQIIAANKIDAVDDASRVKALERHVKKRKLLFHRISAVTGEGVDALLEAAWREIAAVRSDDIASRARALEPEDEGVDLLTPKPRTAGSKAPPAAGPKGPSAAGPKGPALRSR
jgi:GTP-binding protein